MSPDANKLQNLADALSEDLVATPAERLLAEAAEETGDERALAAVFDRVSARAAAQSRRRRIAARVRALAASIVPPTSWKPVMAAVAALAVVVVAGDLYVHVRPNATEPPLNSEFALAPKAVRTVTIQNPHPVTDTTVPDRRLSLGDAPGTGAGTTLPAPAAAPPVEAAAPPPAPAAGDADAPRRIRTFDFRPGAADRVPAPSPAPAPRPAAAPDDPNDVAGEKAKKAPAQQPAVTATSPAVAPAAPAPAARSAVAAARPDDAPSFIWPLRGRLIAHFGPAAGGPASTGVDLAAPLGTDIRAAADGVVAYAGNELKGYGNVILVRHPGGFVTAYAHASKLLVKPNDTVSRGQVIAKSGKTDGAGTPLLHFEVRKESTPVDPMPYLPAQ
jgi:hypothetical protein